MTIEQNKPVHIPQHRTHANDELWKDLNQFKSTVPTYDYSPYEGQMTPLVVDLGSNDVRAGWADSESLNTANKTSLSCNIDPLLIFENKVAKFQDRRLNNIGRTFVGDDCYFANLQSKARSALENGVVTSVDSLESIFDYILAKLSVSSYPVDHPLLITEALCNPALSRSLSSELLFETYSFPSICYSVDSLLSYYHHENVSSRNLKSLVKPTECKSGLIISPSYSATHIIPFIGSNSTNLKKYGADVDNVKKINYGTSNMSEYLINLLDSKYSENTKRYFDPIEKYNQNYIIPRGLTLQNSMSFIQQYCYVSSNYKSDLELIAQRVSSPSSVSSTSKSATPIPSSHEIIVQYPYIDPNVISNNSVNNEEAERLKQEKRKEQGRKLAEMTKKKREQKLHDAEEDLEYLKDIKGLQTTLEKDKFITQIKDSGYGISNVKELDELIQIKEKDVEKLRNKMMGIVKEEETPTFPLIDIPDEELDENQLKEKQRQKFHKVRYESALRQRKEKELIRQQRLEQERLEDENRSKDLEGWLQIKHRERNAVIERILARKRRRLKLSDRKSKESEQKRKTMALMMDDTRNEDNGSGRKRQKQNEDSFGQDDKDWDVYKELQGDDDSEEEEDTMELSQLDDVLIKYDANFIPDDPFEEGKELMDTSLFRLSYGIKPDFDDHAYLNQIRANVELPKVPEVLFQPSIIGLDQAGLIENINQIFKSVGTELANDMAQNIYITGGMSSIKGFKDRVYSEIRKIRPYDSNVNVYSYDNNILCPWKGGVEYARYNNGEFLKQSSITRDMYIEYGSDYIKEHSFGNLWYKNYI